jgi:phosphoserine aminotransferase
VIININSRADHVPSKPGIERLQEYNATWTITETAPQKVHIEFSAMSNTPPMFPRYIQDPIIEKMFHNNLVRLRELLLQ